jgi:hypothetical protein
VWFDGVPIKGPTGEQARTDFRAYRIPAGRHILEIKGENRFKPWREDIDLEAGKIQKVHATLVPATTAVVADGTRSGPARAEAKAEGQGAGAGSSSGKDGKEGKTQARAETKTEAREPRSESRSETTLARAGTTTRPRVSGSTPTPTATDPGAVRRGIKKPAHEPVAENVEESGGDSVKSDGAEGGECSITIGSRPWSEVWIDGKNTTKHTPFADYKVSCGKHKLGFKRPDLQIDHTEIITVRAGQRFKQSFALEAEQQPE